MAKGRTVIQEVLNQPEDFVTFIMNDFFQKSNFVRKEKHGESFYQCGNGMLAAPKFMKYSYVNGVFHLEAWLKTAWLPGVYGSDMDLEGFTGAALKADMKRDINALLQLLHQPIPTANVAN